MSYSVSKKTSYDGLLSYKDMGNHYGLLKGFQCVTNPFNSSLNSLGGLPLLLVIIAPGRDDKGADSYSKLHFALSVELIDTLFELLLSMILSNESNREVMVRTKAFSIFSKLFIHHPQYMSLNFFSNCQKLIRNLPIDCPELLDQFYKYLLFNFRIWERVPFVMQSQVLQYIHSLIEENIGYFSAKFGILFFCDILCSLLSYRSLESQQSSPS